MAESRNQSPNLDVASGRTPIPRPRSAQSRTTSPQTSPRAHVDHGDPLLSQTPDASTTLFSASPTPESREMLSYIERQTGRRRNRGNRTLPKPGLTFRVPSTSTMNATHNVSATQLKDVRAQVKSFFEKEAVVALFPSRGDKGDYLDNLTAFTTLAADHWRGDFPALRNLLHHLAGWETDIECLEHAPQVDSVLEAALQGAASSIHVEQTRQYDSSRPMQHVLNLDTNRVRAPQSFAELSEAENLLDHCLYQPFCDSVLTMLPEMRVLQGQSYTKSMPRTSFVSAAFVFHKKVNPQKSHAKQQQCRTFFSLYSKLSLSEQTIADQLSTISKLHNHVGVTGITIDDLVKDCFYGVMNNSQLSTINQLVAEQENKRDLSVAEMIGIVESLAVDRRQDLDSIVSIPVTFVKSPTKGTPTRETSATRRNSSDKKVVFKFECPRCGGRGDKEIHSHKNGRTCYAFAHRDGTKLDPKTIGCDVDLNMIPAHRRHWEYYKNLRGWTGRKASNTTFSAVAQTNKTAVPASPPPRSADKAKDDALAYFSILYPGGVSGKTSINVVRMRATNVTAKSTHRCVANTGRATIRARASNAFTPKYMRGPPKNALTYTVPNEHGAVHGDTYEETHSRIVSMGYPKFGSLSRGRAQISALVALDAQRTLRYKMPANVVKFRDEQVTSIREHCNTTPPDKTPGFNFIKEAVKLLREVPDKVLGHDRLDNTQLVQARDDAMHAAGIDPEQLEVVLSRRSDGIRNCADDSELIERFTHAATLVTEVFDRLPPDVTYFAWKKNVMQQNARDVNVNTVASSDDDCIACIDSGSAGNIADPSTLSSTKLDQSDTVVCEGFDGSRKTSLGSTARTYKVKNQHGRKVSLTLDKVHAVHGVEMAILSLHELRKAGCQFHMNEDSMYLINKEGHNIPCFFKNKIVCVRLHD